MVFTPVLPLGVLRAARCLDPVRVGLAISPLSSRKADGDLELVSTWRADAAAAAAIAASAAAITRTLAPLRRRPINRLVVEPPDSLRALDAFLSSCSTYPDPVSTYARAPKSAVPAVTWLSLWDTSA